MRIREVREHDLPERVRLPVRIAALDDALVGHGEVRQPSRGVTVLPQRAHAEVRAVLRRAREIDLHGKRCDGAVRELQVDAANGIAVVSVPLLLKVSVAVVPAEPGGTAVPARSTGVTRLPSVTVAFASHWLLATVAGTGGTARGSPGRTEWTCS